MLKRCVIFIFLATAYTVLLAHNFTPHQHNSEHIAAHHQDHEHDHNGDEDENSENSPFHLFQHVGETGIIYTPGQFIRSVTKRNLAQTIFIVPGEALFKPTENSLLIVSFLREKHFSVQKLRPYFFPLKAPPAFTA